MEDVENFLFLAAALLTGLLAVIGLFTIVDNVFITHYGEAVNYQNGVRCTIHMDETTPSAEERLNWCLTKHKHYLGLHE